MATYRLGVVPWRHSPSVITTKRHIFTLLRTVSRSHSRRLFSAVSSVILVMTPDWKIKLPIVWRRLSEIICCASSYFLQNCFLFFGNLWNIKSFVVRSFSTTRRFFIHSFLQVSFISYWADNSGMRFILQRAFSYSDFLALLYIY